MSGWQPIETAPRDESVVLLVWWDTLRRAWRYEARAYSNLDIARQGFGWAHGYATHWQPLPEPPEVSDE